jgi:hypothetical protein
VLYRGQIAFTPHLDSASLSWRGYEIRTTQSWSDDKQSLILKPSIYLPAQDTFKLKVKVHVDSNGVNILNETRIVSFKTGNGLDHIPADNVAGSYPLDGQFNFYPHELTNQKGYIQLIRGQPDLFFDDPNYVKVIRFRKPGGSCKSINLTPSTTLFYSNKLEFDLPSNFFVSEQIYEMDVLNFPKSDPNWGTGYTGQAPCACATCSTPPPPPSNPPGGNFMNSSKGPGSGKNSNPPANNPPSGNPPTEKIMYSAYFRVSQYNSFKEKLDAVLGSAPKPGHIGKHDIADEYNPLSLEEEIVIPVNTEPFDFYETSGMINMQVLFSNSNTGFSSPHWLSGLPDRYFNIYQECGLKIIGGVYSSTLPWKLSEKWVEFTQNNDVVIKITPNYYFNGLPSGFPNVQQKIHHYAPYKMISDYQLISNEAQSFLASHGPDICSTLQIDGVDPDVCNIVNGYYGANYNTGQYSIYLLDLMMGCKNDINTDTKSYPVQFKYILPGTNVCTHTRFVNMIDP